MRIVISNVTLVDNGLGIMPLVYAPPALSHAFADKPVHVQVREEASPFTSDVLLTPDSPPQPSASCTRAP